MTTYTYRLPNPILSERHGTPPYTHCVACSVVMAVNGKRPGTCPETYAEADALYRAAYTDHAGESVEAVIAAAKKRYPSAAWPETLVTGGFAEFWKYLSQGHGAPLIGRPANLPAASKLRAGVGLSFTALHCIYVIRETSEAKVWVGDPMDRDGIGFHVNSTDLAKFAVDPKSHELYDAAAIFRVATV